MTSDLPEIKKYRLEEIIDSNVSLAKNVLLNRLVILKGSSPKSLFPNAGTYQDFSELSLTSSSAFSSGQTLLNIEKQILTAKELSHLSTRDNLQIIPFIMDWSYDENGKPLAFFSMEIPQAPNTPLTEIEHYKGSVYTLNSLMKKIKFSNEDLLKSAGEMSHRYRILNSSRFDIKPSNILVILKSPENLTLNNAYHYVLDLETVKTNSSGPFSSVGKIPFGTLAYMPPEDHALYLAINHFEQINFLKSKHTQNNLALISNSLGIDEKVLADSVNKIIEDVKSVNLNDPRFLIPNIKGDTFSLALTYHALQNGHPYKNEFNYLSTLLPKPWAMAVSQELFFRMNKTATLSDWRFPFLSSKLKKSLNPNASKRPDMENIESAYFGDEHFQRLIKNSKIGGAFIGTVTVAYLVLQAINYYGSSEFTKSQLLNQLDEKGKLESAEVYNFFSRLANEKINFVTDFRKDGLINLIIKNGDKSAEFSSNPNPSFEDGFSVEYDALISLGSKSPKLIERLNQDLLLLKSNFHNSPINSSYGIFHAAEVLGRENFKEHVPQENSKRFIQAAKKLASEILENRYVGNSNHGFFTLKPLYKVVIDKEKDVWSEDKLKKSGDFVFEPYAQLICKGLIDIGVIDRKKMENNFNFLAKYAVREDGSSNENILVDTSNFLPKAHFNYFSDESVNYGFQKSDKHRSTNLLEHQYLLSAAISWLKHDKKIKPVVSKMIEFGLRVFDEAGYFPEEVIQLKNSHNIANTNSNSPNGHPFESYTNSYIDKSNQSIRANDLAAVLFLENMFSAKKEGINVEESKFTKIMGYLIKQAETDKSFPGILQRSYQSSFDQEGVISRNAANAIFLNLLKSYASEFKN